MGAVSRRLGFGILLDNPNGTLWAYRKVGSDAVIYPFGLRTWYMGDRARPKVYENQLNCNFQNFDVPLSDWKSYIQGKEQPPSEVYWPGKEAAIEQQWTKAMKSKLCRDADVKEKEDKLMMKGEWTLAELQDKELCIEYCLSEFNLHTQKESLLSDVEFSNVFGMDREKFAALPGWKQTSAKTKLKIF